MIPCAVFPRATEVSPLSLGEGELGDLPFLPEAGELLVRRGYALTISELSGAWGEPFVEAGIRRARAAVLEGSLGDSLDGMPPEQRILSFVIAALIVGSSGNAYAVKRFALAEARRLEERILRRMRSNRQDAATLLAEIYSRVLGVRLDVHERRIGAGSFDARLGLVDYLRLSSALDASRWGIANRVVDGGYVYVRLEDAVRLLRGGVAEAIERRVLSARIANPPAPLAQEASRLAQEVARSRPAPSVAPAASHGQYPPCVRSLMKRLESGENLPHSARFFLATFLINLGVPLDEVVGAFSRSPDFNERITRYQVEHIAGLRGGKRYSVPSCAKLQAQGLCARDETCDNVRSPLAYARRRARPAEAGGDGAGGGKGTGGRRDRIPEDEL
ncbi:MAG: hypothetical protein ACP5NG_00400 [Conexivisphaera sp.]